MTEQEIRDKVQQLVGDIWVDIYSSQSIAKQYKHLYNKHGCKKCRPWHLSKGSHKKIQFKCLECKKLLVPFFQSIFKSSNFTCLCNSCSGKLIGKNKTKDIAGIKLNRLTAISPTIKKSGSSIVWKFHCECGTICEVSINSFLSENTKSCGCLQREKVREFNVKRHKKLGHFIKEEHTKEEIYEHLKRQSEKNNQIEHFNKQIAEDRKYLCYFTCKNEWGNIEVHHLQGRDKFPELTYDLNNLVCLRKDIHKEFHGLYCYGNNIVTQFYEFLTLYSRRR